MKKTKLVANEGGLNGSGKGVLNVNSTDFIALRNAIEVHAENTDKLKSIEHELFSIELQMINYVQQTNIEAIKEICVFLKAAIKSTNIKHAVFAQYAKIEASNLSAILNNKRRISVEFAVKIGYIFNINPNLWLQVQSKNDLLKIELKDKSEFQKLSLQDLLKKAS